MNSTKARILDSAEHLFAERGYAASTVREITAEAEVNLAAFHYHFHSKEILLNAALARRTPAIESEQRKLFDRFKQEANGHPVRLDLVIESFLAPLFQVAHQGPGGSRFARLIGRLHAERDMLPFNIADALTAAVDRCAEALSRAAEGLKPEELRWRMHFAVGAISHTLRAGYQVHDRERTAGLPSDWMIALRHLVDFLVASLETRDIPKQRQTTASHE